MPSRFRPASVLRSLPVALGLFLGLVPAASAQSPTLSLEKQVVGSTTVPSGQVFSYRLLYRCASTTTNCLGAKIEDVIPAELSGAASDVQVIGNAQTASVGYDAATRKATWTFVSPLAAGATGEVRLSVKFANGTTPDGTTTTNSATFSATNASPVTATAPVVTATAQGQATLDKTLTSGSVVGGNFQYRIRFATASTGSLDYQNVVVKDVLPAGAVFVSASSGGTYDAATRTVTWTPFSTTSGTAVDRTLTLQYPEGTFASGQSVTNTATATGTPVGGTPQTISDDVSHTLTAPTCSAATTFSSISPNEATVGFGTGFRIRVRNTGNVPFTGYTVTQNVPVQINATKFYFRGDTSPVRVEYTTNLNGSWRTAGTYTTNSSASVSSLGLAANEYVTAFRYTFTGALPAGFDRSDYGFDGTVLAVGRNGVAVATPSTIPITGSYGYSCGSGGSGGGPGGPGTGAAVGVNGSVPVVPPTAYWSLNKAITSSPTTVAPGATLGYRLRVGNQAYASASLASPVIADLLPAGVEYVDGSASVAPIEVVPNHKGTGRTLVRWQLSQTFAAGQTTDITFSVRVLETTAAGTLANNFHGTGSSNTRTGGSSSANDTNDLDRDGNTTEKVYPSNTVNATVLAVAQLDSRKWVKGSLDAAYSRYPEVGQTVPGGLADYRLVVFNTGNVPMSNMKIVDILPFVGDRGVVADEPRNSAWRPNLIGPVTVPAGVTVYYSTEPNPCRTDLNTSSPAGCTGPTWSTTPPADITSVQSLKFDFGSTVVASRDSVELTWQMRAPYGAPPSIVAWNSFGYVATRTDGGGDLLASEPIKVGIKVNAPVPADYGNFVWNDLNANGVQDPGEPGINGVRVELVNVGPDGTYGTADDYAAIDRSGNTLEYTITGDDQNGEPGYYVFPYLHPGTYVAKVFPPSGYEISPQNAGSDDEKDSDIDPTSHLIAPRTLDAGQFDYTNDAGLFQRAALGDRVWYDTNANGVQDAGETGVEGVTVTLYGADGTTALATTTTDANGAYAFSGLMPGTYSVGFSNLPATYRATTANAGSDDAADSDADPATLKTAPVTLASGDNNTTLDLGIYAPASLGNFVWIDTNGNGVQDAGEPGVEGVTVTLYDASGKTLATTTTDEDGAYSFTDLVPGTYSVGFSKLPSGTTFTTADTGSDDALDSDADPSTGKTASVTLVSGDNNTTLDAGLIAPPKAIDLSLAKSVSTPTPRVGDVVTYTVTLSNAGPDTATGIAVNDVLPAGLTFVRFTNGTTGDVTGQTLSFAVASLGAGKTATFTYEARVTTAGSWENVAEVMTANETDTDSSPGNGDPSEDDQAGAPITTSGTSGGGGAGVESNGSMATLLAQRLVLRREDVQARAALLETPVVAFDVAGTAPSLSLDGTGAASASVSGSASVLRQIVPTTGPQATPAFETTPGDLLGVTNAREVVATDYVRPDGRRLAALFGATSPSGVLYDHTKATCDRLGGGRLDYVRTITVDGQPFVLSKLVQADGTVDYAISFVAYRMSGGTIVESRFAPAQYAVPAGTQEVLNLQVWSVTPEYTATLVSDMLTRLRAVGPVEVRGGASVPAVYVVDGRYEGGQIRLRLRNTTGRALTVGVEGKTATTEALAMANQRQTVSTELAVPASTGLVETVLPVGMLYDGTFTLDGALSGDQFYMADGTWGTNKGTATVSSFTTNVETRTPSAGTMLVERSARVSGTVTDYVSLFRFLRAGGTPVDLSGYHSLEFTYRSDVPVQVLVEKASVASWAGKFVANLPANPSGAAVRVRLEDLAPAGGQTGRFTGEDVTMVAFYALGNRSSSRSFTLELSNVRFVTGAVTDVEETPAVVTELALSNVAPNPVRERGTVRVAMPTAGRARVTVYDLMGRTVATLHEGDLPAGETRLTLDASALASGTYVMRLETATGTQTRTITVNR